MIPPDWFEQIRAEYPKRKGQGWINAKRQIEKHLANGESFDAMLRGTINYRRYCATSGEFVRMARTHFGPSMFWLEFQDNDTCENEITVDDEAADVGLIRAPFESDEVLQRRIAIAQVNKQYKLS